MVYYRAENPECGAEQFPRQAFAQRFWLALCNCPAIFWKTFAPFRQELRNTAHFSKEKTGGVEKLRQKMQRRYFAVLFFPFLIILCLAIWLTFFSHGKGMQAMRNDVEGSRLSVAQSVAANIDTLIEQVRLNAANLAIQINKVDTGTAYQLALYRSTIGQMAYLQLNTESLLNPLVNRGYVFLFQEDQAISQSSTLHEGMELYNNYFRLFNGSYADFKERFTSSFYSGALLPEVEIGYMDESYTSWVVAQSIPTDPSVPPTGVIFFTLDSSTMRQRLGEGMTDADSLCLFLSGGKMVAAQGASRRWSDAAITDFQLQLQNMPSGVYHLRASDGTDCLVAVATGSTGTVASIQPAANAFSGLQEYRTGMLVLTAGLLLLGIVVAALFTRRNLASVQDVIDAIAPQNQSASATTVFEYMQEAIRSSQQKEAQLSAWADEQRNLFRNLFLRRLLQGELPLESDILREQPLAGINLEAASFVVLLMRPAAEAQNALPEIAHVLAAEFGSDRQYLVEMEPGDFACLLLGDGSDLRESIEAVAEALSQRLQTVTYASTTVFARVDIPQAWRQVRVMGRLALENGSLHWYDDLYQDDALYNFEYTVYSETRLRNNIAAGNSQGVQTILEELYEKSLQSSVRSDHVLRFFAYDLYRLVNHLGVGGEAEAQKAFLHRLQGMLDSVMEDPRGFDAFFAEIRSFCLRACEQNQNPHTGNAHIVEAVKDYIDKHYAEPTLSVSGIADTLHLSDKYLSQLFREQTNGKISACIEEKRIAHACHLLDTTQLSINEVALASGYALTHTFRVAFKKVQGVTPLEYKKSRQQNASSPER